MLRIHAITIHHRGRELLDRCLSTLLASEGVDLEVIVVSNACEEPLPEIVERSPSVHLVRTLVSLGFSAANNLGVRFSKEHLGGADAYYFLNNDTESTPDALAVLANELERKGGEMPVGAVGPRLLILDAPDHLNSLGLNVTLDGWGWDEGIGISLEDYGTLPGRRPVAALTGAAVLVGAKPLDEVGGWPEIYGYYFEDIDLCFRLWERGYEIVNQPDATVFHQISATMTEDSEGARRKEYFFLRNHLLLAAIHWPPFLLAGVLRRAVAEILGSWKHASRHRRALGELFLRTPQILRERLRVRGTRRWRTFLRPPGSVPVITLPRFEEAPRPKLDESLERRLAGHLPPVGKRRVLVVGWSPLPFEEGRMNLAPGARTWQLARSLAADGHAVVAACGRIPGTDTDGPDGEPSVDVEVRERDEVLCLGMDWDDFVQGPKLGDVVEAFAPDVVVGAAAVPSRRACEVAGERPVWVDLFGDPMAEAQARAAVHPDEDDPLTAYAELLLDVLSRGDAFSAVSGPQRAAVLGQLGLVGRLGAATAGEELVWTIPCAVESEGGDASDPAAEPSVVLPGGAFVVLWSGGYNTWCDAEALFAGLERAMAEEPSIVFVSTGGELAGHDETTYGAFRRRVEASPHRERYHLLGCLPREGAEAWQRRADLGVVTEKRLVERELGSSGRMVRFLSVGLPFVATESSELARELAADGLAVTYPVGDADALAERLVAAARAGRPPRTTPPPRLDALATTEPLRRWVDGAERAPDAGAQPLVVGHRREEELRRELERRDEYRRQLEEIHASKMWALWMTSIDTRQKLRGLLRRG